MATEHPIIRPLWSFGKQGVWAMDGVNRVGILTLIVLTLTNGDVAFAAGAGAGAGAEVWWHGMCRAAAGPVVRPSPNLPIWCGGALCRTM